MVGRAGAPSERSGGQEGKDTGPAPPCPLAAGPIRQQPGAEVPVGRRPVRGAGQPRLRGSGSMAVPTCGPVRAQAKQQWPVRGRSQSQPLWALQPLQLSFSQPPGPARAVPAPCPTAHHPRSRPLCTAPGHVGSAPRAAHLPLSLCPQDRVPAGPAPCHSYRGWSSGGGHIHDALGHGAGRQAHVHLLSSCSPRSPVWAPGPMHGEFSPLRPRDSG